MEKESIIVIVAWGNENNNILSEMDDSQYKKWLIDNVGQYGVHKYEFDTEAQVNAFIKGIEESNGWDDYNICMI